MANSSGWSLVKEMCQVLLEYPRWLAASILSTVVVVGLEPSLAWVGKRFIDDLKKDQTDYTVLLPNYIVLFGGLLLGLGLLKFGDKMIDKIYELKLVIRLQRLYLERRGCDRGAEDISRVIIDSEKAKAGLDIIHKDAGKIVFQSISVILWQLTLAPQWLPALLIAVLPPMLIGFIFGRFIQRASLGRLQAQQHIATSTSEAKRLELHTHQAKFMQHTIRLEIFKSSTEILMDLVQWFGLLMLVLLNSILPINLVPQNIQAGDLVLFIANLNLLSKPLGEIVKVYNKTREAYPALMRVFRPEPKTDATMEVEPSG
ncbi:MAG: ABC transporter ATP-binding protein [Acaryochloris sp. SU_5_25]|nr:ABC transporter ATP-binding protein [Acaryochloris sp. SU_5_25]